VPVADEWVKLKKQYRSILSIWRQIIMAFWINLGQILPVNAKKFPDKTAMRDAKRSFTFREFNERVNALSHALLHSGLHRGDKIAVLLENSIEICELYHAAAKTGLVIVPINFRLVGKEILYILENSDSRALFVHDEFCGEVDRIRDNVKNITRDNYFAVGDRQVEGYMSYERFLENRSTGEPGISVNPEDPWVLLYTSGTTGKPKGVVRSHESYIAFYLINGIDFGFNEHDICLNVMPLCHVNSTFFTFNVTYVGGTVFIHPARHFDPEEVFAIIQREKITFISLVPTHYQLILEVDAERRTRYDLRSIRKLLCSSAPARKETKLGIMECFSGVQLFEGYGSTEAGIVTVLKPGEQLRKLGSIGRESSGTDFVKILDEEGKPVSRGQVGELYSRGPMLFDEYYRMPEKTRESFRGEWFSARDMAYEDEEGYYYLVDRKDNLIITGGEKVFPSEVEEVVCSFSKVFDAAVIGLPDLKWGEKVVAVVIGREGADCTEEEILEYCRGRLAGYKRPKRVIFVRSDEMPRTATGKILHRKLRGIFTPNEE
jgi:acyl-CoA synthetase (AMP-forming)/AMP-acid ligase II